MSRHLAAALLFSLTGCPEQSRSAEHADLGDQGELWDAFYRDVQRHNRTMREGSERGHD